MPTIRSTWSTWGCPALNHLICCLKWHCYSMSLRFYTRLLTFPREQLYKGWQFSHPSHPVSMPSIPPYLPHCPPFLTVSPSVCESVFQSCGESGSLSATSSLTFTLHLFSLPHYPLFPLPSLFSSLVHFLAVFIQLTSPDISCLPFICS